ncbi:MAG: flagellar basal-body rod protein FlgF [Acuticoccus sp.]
MPSDLYVALSGQIMMQERLATVANNVANMRTRGFRAETVDFDTIFSSTRSNSVSFATRGESHIQRHAGPAEQTGNAFDVAVVGEGWFGIETPAGTAYTRDGRFKMSETGDLVTLTGYPVLDEGGAAIALDVDKGPIAVGGDGRITQDGDTIGVLGLFAIAPEATLSRYGDSAVLADTPAEPIVDRLANGVRQGFVEGSNVNAVRSITELIEVQRAFEYGVNVVSDRHGVLQQAVRALGPE